MYNVMYNVNLHVLITSTPTWVGLLAMHQDRERAIERHRHSAENHKLLIWCATSCARSREPCACVCAALRHHWFLKEGDGTERGATRDLLLPALDPGCATLRLRSHWFLSERSRDASWVVYGCAALRLRLRSVRKQALGNSLFDVRFLFCLMW